MYYTKEIHSLTKDFTQKLNEQIKQMKINVNVDEQRIEQKLKELEEKEIHVKSLLKSGKLTTHSILDKKRKEDLKIYFQDNLNYDFKVHCPELTSFIVLENIDSLTPYEIEFLHMKFVLDYSYKKMGEIVNRSSSYYGHLVSKTFRRIYGIHRRNLINNKINIVKKIDKHPRDIPIFSITWSSRTANCLQNIRIKTLFDLCNKTEGQLLRSKNLGRKTINEIKFELQRMGLSLGMKETNIDLVLSDLS